MGVPGLWDILRPAGQQRSLTHLAVVDGFEKNPGGRRGLRVGIDASIWFYHATYGREGENPELRTLFFRCARLMSKPFLPLFVFDGPKRPKLKRKKKVSGKDHWMISGMQEIIEAFGFEWRMAPGEAEAELAYLNRIGIIDVIITDDVDTFLFGARTVVRNPGKMLTGNSAHPVKNSAGKDDDEHVFTYNAEDIASHEDIQLTTEGLILIGLLRGGDYDPEGLANCGPNVAHALARCGFGDTLVKAARSLPRERLLPFLSNWRHEVRQELKTNSRGFLNTKKAKLASTLPDTFPDVDVLLLYTNPVTSESTSRAEAINYRWDREPDLCKLAALCERKFEWGVKEIIVKRFRTVIWAPAVLRILRRAALNEDERLHRNDQTDDNAFSTPRKTRTAKPPNTLGTPSTMITKHFSSLRLDEENDEDNEDTRLIVKIHSKREHASTDGVLEYRLEIAPAQLVRLAEAGVQGVRQRPPTNSNSDDSFDSEDEDEDGKAAKKKKGVQKPPPEPGSHLRIWIPASMVRLVEPDMVNEFEGLEKAKAKKKSVATERKTARMQGLPTRKQAAKKQMKANTASNPPLLEDEEEDFSEVFGLGNPAGEATARPRLKASRAAAIVSEEEEEEENVDVPLPSKAKHLKVVDGEGIPEDGIDAWLAPRALKPKAKSSSPRAHQTSTAKAVLSKAPKRSALLDLLDNDTSGVFSASQPSSSKPSVLTTLGLSPTLSSPRPGPSISRPKMSTARKISARSSGSETCPLLSSPNKSPRTSKKHSSPKAKNNSMDSRFEREKSPSAIRKPVQSMKPLLAAKARSLTEVSIRREEEEEEESSGDDRTRPASPSPARPVIRSKPFKPTMKSIGIIRQTTTRLIRDIIEISSSSDELSPPRSLANPPAFGKSKGTSAITFGGKNQRTAFSEVIDLTL